LIDNGAPLPVDRVHNLENLQGMYEYDELDVLVNEAIANAVDAFRDHSIKSGKIDITFSKKNSSTGYVSFHNNAPPMDEKQFYGVKGYHQVSFSSKRKGNGIGFAGVGAKLFLTSEQGGQIITVTGKSKTDFMASKMHKIDDDVKFMTTQKYPLKRILEIPNYSHKFGTTYSVRLTNHAYKYFKDRLSRLIQYWWNHALLTKQIVVTIDGKSVSPWIPRGKSADVKFQYKKEKFDATCFIAKETIPDTSLHVIYTVFGKRIYHKPISLVNVKPDYANRVFCIVDVSILADRLTTNKEGFKKSIYANDLRHHIENGFFKFLEKEGLTTNDLMEPKRQQLKNELTKRLEDLFKDKEFSNLNPFLITKKQKILTPNADGDTPTSEIPGEGVPEGKGGKEGDGSKPGTGDGTSIAEDEDGNEVAKKREKRAKGLHIIYDDGIKIHKDEAIVSIDAGGVIIDTQHPFWLACKRPRELSNFNEMRIVIEALIIYKNNEVEWDAEETLKKYRAMIHKIWTGQ
jgi:hypothetical protein